ncbi:hypothetical protein GDO86_018566 [Hymenochirus boettgeri]|uniref:Tsukushi n=1 Tax=Hymenochirus boettgeri TaxID=247094 RepID=A0A8T2IK89_9PIPI|nr:hypothetical protein GDO86_018566 [Hymenochirus boettgeri]KAG8431489.1 hypothetical protein GDO86_018566 [Hymenochirus boettgeri]KAG8431490.1 hypothetical protein GDO86_018566 [Hymenochirus boettgeri]
MALSAWLYVFILQGMVGASKSCFPECRCEVENFGLFHSFSLTKVDCSDVGSHVVPVSIPLDTSYLDLSSNKLKRVNESVLSGPGYTTLVNLNLSNNLLVKISSSTFSKLRYLESLDLSHNLLEVLPDQSFFYSPLAEIDLSYNNLLEVRMGAFTLKSQGKSMIVDLSHNSIGSVFRGADNPVPNIQSLILSGNNLISVPNLNGIPLRHLSLDRNPVAKIKKNDLSGLGGLTHLSLSDLPNLRDVDPYSFKDLTSLLVLDLSNNRNLIALSSEVFYGLDSLQELNLANSGVSNFPKETLRHLPSMKVISLGVNVNCVKSVKERPFHHEKGLVMKEVLLCRDENGSVSAQDVL